MNEKSTKNPKKYKSPENGTRKKAHKGPSTGQSKLIIYPAFNYFFSTFNFKGEVSRLEL